MMKRSHIFVACAFLATALALAACGKSGDASKDAAGNTVAKADTAWICPMRCEGDKTYASQVNCPVCGMALADAAATKTVYYCPMKCEGEKTYGAAGTCPKCGMNLVDKKVRPM